MNYRHGFHAGNHADALKHAVLAAALSIMTGKPKPMTYLDAFAGAGGYDLLLDERAARTNEWRSGAARVWPRGAVAEIPALAPYGAALAARNPNETLRYYPGSPQIAQTLLRTEDRIRLVELQPAEAELLSDAMSRDSRIKIFAEDGWKALSALLPPTPRRGLVLIDPPFEQPGEFDRMAGALKAGLKRWATGVFLLWHPIVDPAAVARYLNAATAAAGAAPCLSLSLTPRAGGGGLLGSGMVCVNPPYGLEDAAAAFGPALAAALAQDDGAPGWRADWLVPPR